MLLEQTKLETDIERSLDRLRIVTKGIDVAPSIPAFYYSASLLNQYAQLNGPDNVRCDFFTEFQTLIIQFGKQDFSHITKNHQSIVDDILEIVDSQLFMDCTRQDIYKSRGQCMKKAYEELDQIQKDSIIKQFKNTSTISPSKKTKMQPVSPTKTSSSFALNQFDQIWQSVQRSYREHNLDAAFRKANDYMQKVGQKVQIPANRQQIINDISKDYMKMVNLYDQFDKPGWQFDKQDKGITLEYKVFQQQKQIAIRICGEFDIPIVQFLAIISEIDLMGEYVPFCYDCKELRMVSRNQRIGTSKIYIPLLSDRETYFFAEGYDRMQETNSIFLYSKTINEDYAFMEKYNYQVPPATDKFVRLQYKFFIVEYTPVTKYRSKIRLASKIDMKMNYLPLFILNKSARIFAFDYFKNILEKVKNYKGSAWQKKVQEKPQMYDFFHRKINEYLGK